MVVVRSITAVFDSIIYIGELIPICRQPEHLAICADYQFLQLYVTAPHVLDKDSTDSNGKSESRMRPWEQVWALCAWGSCNRNTVASSKIRLLVF